MIQNYSSNTASHFSRSSANEMSISDMKKHVHVIEQLANEIGRPAQEIEPLYVEILAHFRATASIPDYLAILVSKRIKYILKH